MEVLVTSDCRYEVNQTEIYHDLSAKHTKILEENK